MSINLKTHNGNGIRFAMHLSAPKGGCAQMLRDPDGDWVSWNDYARLKAEVERLRKAGDAMAFALYVGPRFHNEDGENLYDGEIKNWNAAKDGTSDR
jgi:hypothetical protein